MNVFKFRDQVIENYADFSRSFVRFSAADIFKLVDGEYSKGRYWPEPLVQINPNYKTGESVEQLSKDGVLDPLTAEIFQIQKTGGERIPVRLYKHQQDAIALAQQGRSYVVTTGTGSGKSLAFFIPIVDQILKAKAADSRPRTRAIIIYPMNALAHDQRDRLAAPPQFGEVRGGITYELHRERAALRFTFGRTSTRADVDAVLDAIGPAVERARAVDSG